QMFIWLPKGWNGFAVLDATRAGNANLVAQRGYLTAHVLGSVPEGAWDKPWAEPALEELLQQSDTLARLKRFELHRRHAPRLLALLKRYGVSTASLFPDYAGIVRSVKERIS